MKKLLLIFLLIATTLTSCMVVNPYHPVYYGHMYPHYRYYHPHYFHQHYYPQHRHR